MAEMFHYCERCNKAVPAKIRKCECGNRFRGDSLYTREAIEELTAGRKQKEDFDDGQMICPNCGRLYDLSHSMCEDCHMLLRSYFAPEEAEEAETEPLEAEEEPEVSGRELAGMSFKVCRIQDASRMPGREIRLEGDEIAVGRGYLHQHCFPEMSLEEVNRDLRSISRKNALLRRAGSDWFISYDYTDERKKKSVIRINGVPMQEEGERRLVPGDRLFLGKASCGIEMDLTDSVAEPVQNAFYGEDLKDMIKNAMQEIMVPYAREQKEDLNQLRKTAEHIQDNTMQIRQTLELLQKVSARNFDTLQEFWQTARSEADRVIARNKETGSGDIDYLDHMLNGKKEKYGRLLGQLSSAQERYLFYAAFYEYTADTVGGGDMDYSAAYIFLGKMLENFTYHTIMPLAHKYAQERWSELKQKQEYGGVTIGDLSKIFTYRDKETGEPKGRKIIWKLVDDYRPGSVAKRQALFHEIEASFGQCDKARMYRNEAAHSDLEAKLPEELKKIDQKTFKEAKKNILDTDFIPNISRYRTELAGAVSV